MTVIEFLGELVQEYRHSGLHSAATELQFALTWLTDGNSTEAIKSIEQSKTLILEEMKKYPRTIDGYSRDMALLNTLQKMVEGYTHA